MQSELFACVVENVSRARAESTKNDLGGQYQGVGHTFEQYRFGNRCGNLRSPLRVLEAGDNRSLHDRRHAAIKTSG
ncbi:hypothetical protein QO002_006107 [Pararhizobium capsulatum DSM 1112]|uniref:Uncharacterized protein n=1 Tax=Pararhizobium capsulatum DSM 1112 TaxID=1121113 RepID=A0ABU0C2K0_9HYPH|nr:hypothetical protein [Pararhizobium capsulatum DSM 1112]